MSNLNKKFQSSTQFSRLSQLYQKVDDVMGGKETMKAAGVAYLPKLPAESLANYQHRLDSAVFKPIYPRTIEKAVGKAFVKGLNVTTLPEFERLLDNADGAGTGLETFSKELLKDAIHYGITYLLVDYPVTTPNATLADERASGAFPYFVNIKPTSILDLRTAYNGSKVEVVYLRFMESVEEFDSTYNVTEIDQVKEFILMHGEDGDFVTYNIYRKDENNEVFLYDTNTLMTLDYIPLIPVYGNKVSSFIGEPSLMELAEQSISHWVAYANYRNLADFTAIPLLQVKGLKQNPNENGEVDEFVVSPNMAYMLESDGELKYAEVTGTGLSKLLEGIKDLEASMAASGLELTSITPGGVGPSNAETATGRIIDEAESNSILKSMVKDLTWSLYWGFVTAGEMIGVDTFETTVDIDSTYTVMGNSSFNEMMELYKEGVITATELMTELKTKGLFQSEPILVKDEWDTEPESVEEIEDNPFDTDSTE